MAAMIAKRSRAAGSPARSTPQAIVSREDPIIVFHTEKLVKIRLSVCAATHRYHTYKPRAVRLYEDNLLPLI